MVIWFGFAIGLGGWKKHSEFRAVNASITCSGTELPFPDSETHCKPDPSFENISSPTSRLPYIDIIQQILWITHLVRGTILGAIDTTIYKRDFVTILMKELCSDKSYAEVYNIYLKERR